MREPEMIEIAEFMKRVVIDNEPAEKIKEDVEKFRRGFRKVHFAFDTARDAYEYIRVR